MLRYLTAVDTRTEFVFGGLVTYLIGGWDVTQRVLLIMMCVDIFSGIYKSLHNPELGGFSSRKFREGLLHKSAYFFVLILAFQIDTIMGNSEPVVRTVATIYYIAVEGTSLIENLGAIGVPVPSFIKKRLSALMDKADNEELPEPTEHKKN